MIEYIEGRVSERNPAYIVIDCNGIAYFIHVSLNTFTQVKEAKHLKLFIHQVIREDAHQLYGFYDSEERKIFRHLISVSGVGANTARMILSSLSVFDVQNAILSGNVATLQKIKGIGSKSAQRIIVDLKDKISKQDFTAEATDTQFTNIREEAVLALSMLGFTRSASEKTIDKILNNNSSEITVEELLKQALKNL